MNLFTPNPSNSNPYTPFIVFLCAFVAVLASAFTLLAVAGALE